MPGSGIDVYFRDRFGGPVLRVPELIFFAAPWRRSSMGYALSVGPIANKQRS